MDQEDVMPAALVLQMIEAVVVIEREREERRREKVRMSEEGVETMSRSKCQRDRGLLCQI
jgi:hypothetical protein